MTTALSEWMTTGMLLSSGSLTEPWLIRQSELLAMEGAGRVRSNAEGSKSASAPDRSGKFKKQRRVPCKKYVQPKEWKHIRRYKTCYGARLDDEDIEFDMYQKAQYLM